MKFVDYATIEVIAGNGGDGCVGFRREKFIPFGGPDGGDGGDGGHIIVEGSSSLNTLSEFRSTTIFRAKHGQNGSGQNKRGKSSDNLYIKLPLGTQIYNLETDELIGELLNDEQKIIVARGGFHGLGNTRFKSSINRTPRQFTKGTKGENRHLNLELKVMADVGLLGLPNAGKSSFIRSVSSAKPKVANYPFTTLHPNLGVVNIGYDSFVIADIPGIIKDANIGVGLGFEFLKHLSRTKVLLHIVDILPADGSHPADNYHIIINELKQYDEKLFQKPRLLVINKIDLIAQEKRQQTIDNLLKAINDDIHDYTIISTLNKTGVPDLLKKLYQTIQHI